MSLSLKSVATFLVTLALASSQARAADLLLDNLSGPVGTTGVSTLLSTTRAKAAGFTMGASDSVVNSLTLRLDGYTTGDILTVDLRNDTGGSDPGSTVLLSFNQPVAQGAGTFDYTFTPSASYTLQASTKYWLYVTMQTQVGTALYWIASSPSVNPSTSLATLNSYRFTTNSGSTWSSSSTLNTFQLTGVSSVPEPSSVILAGASITAIAALSWNRRRKS